MSEQLSQGEGGGTAVAEATPKGTGGVVASENLVTPAIQAKFDEVFGGKEASADRESGAGPTGKKQGKAQPTARTPQRRPVFESDPNEDANEAAIVAEVNKGRRQPEANHPQNESPLSQQERSRVQTDPGQSQQQGQEGQESTLSPILRQAAMRAKWEPEVIEQFWAEQPELAEKTFSNLHRSQNELSARFAAFSGQQPPQPQRGQSVNPQQVPNVNPQNPQAVMQLMMEAYGGEENFKKLNADWNNAVPTLIQPMVERVIAPMQQMLQEAMQFIGGQERQNIAREATMWMDGIKKDFGDVYGIGTRGVSPEQRTARMELTQYADRIRIGARSQGVQMSVTEALELAHSALAAPHYASVERNRITAQIKRRTSSITQRPTQRKNPVPGEDGNKKTLAGAQAAYAAKLVELGIGPE